MRMLGLAPTFPLPLMCNIKPEHLQTQTEDSVAQANLMSLSEDATCGDYNEPLVGNVVDQQEAIIAAVERANIAVSNLFGNSMHKEHIQYIIRIDVVIVR